MKRFTILLGCISLMVLGISACGSNQAEADTPVQRTTYAAPGTGTVIDPASTAGYFATATGLPTTSLETPSTPFIPDSTAPTATRQVKTELEASDPNGVTLASGQVHLVEFFAFW